MLKSPITYLTAARRGTGIKQQNVQFPDENSGFKIPASIKNSHSLALRIRNSKTEKGFRQMFAGAPFRIFGHFRASVAKSVVKVLPQSHFLGCRSEFFGVSG
jgi:hypothetical protein